MKKYFNELFHLIYEKDLPDNSFLINGISCDVPCVFQIWEKKEEKRKIINKKEVKQDILKFVKKNIEDKEIIVFRRVGVNAGHVVKLCENINVSEQSNYFIKFINDSSIDENIAMLKKLKFDFNNTVGPKSISKSELLAELIKMLELQE